MDEARSNNVGELIRRHRVRYEVNPYYVLARDQRVLSGFDIELYGTNLFGAGRWLPGNEQSVETYRDLHRIAEWILPKVNGRIKCEILPYDNAVHACAKSHMEPEVLLTVRISHFDGLIQPANEEQEECVREARLRLSEVGIV